MLGQERAAGKRHFSVTPQPRRTAIVIGSRPESQVLDAVGRQRVVRIGGQASWPPLRRTN
jgi:hypothetical protein